MQKVSIGDGVKDKTHGTHSKPHSSGHAMSATVQIVVHNGEAVCFSPYAALDIIKAIVPSCYRHWDKTKKCWRIEDATFINSLANALRADGYTVHITNRDGSPWTPPGQRKAAGHGSTPAKHWVEQAFHDCPSDRIERLRRGLMTAFHPDLGGDPALAQRINSAADTRLGRNTR
jgi:hypothetical protein